MIIDKKNPGHSHIPETLDGEVLLEETKDSEGNTTGFLTASKQSVADFKSAAPAERVTGGWEIYQSVIDSMPAEDLPTPKPIPVK